jgi:hypothetical protein
MKARMRGAAFFCSHGQFLGVGGSAGQITEFEFAR